MFHIHIANQFSYEQKQKLLQTIKYHSCKGDIAHLYNNM